MRQVFIFYFCQSIVLNESLHSFDETQSFSGQSRRSTQEAWSVTGHLTEKHENVAKFGLLEVSSSYKELC